jgi:hypothetical protein
MEVDQYSSGEEVQTFLYFLQVETAAFWDRRESYFREAVFQGAFQVFQQGLAVQFDELLAEDAVHLVH